MGAGMEVVGDMHVGQSQGGVASREMTEHFQKVGTSRNWSLFLERP